MLRSNEIYEHPTEQGSELSFLILHQTQPSLEPFSSRYVRDIRGARRDTQ